METVPVPATQAPSRIPDFVGETASDGRFKEYLDAAKDARDARGSRPDDAPADTSERNEEKIEGRNETDEPSTEPTEFNKSQGQDAATADTAAPETTETTEASGDGETAAPIVSENIDTLPIESRVMDGGTVDGIVTGDDVATTEFTPADGADPATLAQDADGAIPATPATPATPAVPSESIEAATPAIPATPANAAQNEARATPAERATASDSNGRATPATPATPAVPATPANTAAKAAQEAVHRNQNAAGEAATPAIPATPNKGEGPATPATPATPAAAAQTAAAGEADAAAFEHGSSSGDDSGASRDGEPRAAAEAFGKELPAASRAAALPAQATPNVNQGAALPTQAAADLSQIPATETADRLMTLQRAPEAKSHTVAPQANQPTVAAAFGSEVRPIGDTTGIAQASYGTRGDLQPASQQVAIQISRAVQDGNNRFTIELKPVTMGRVTIKLEVGHDNRVIAVLSAERPDTLELLQRDSRVLEQALRDAGLDTDSGSLSFSLEGENGEDEGPDGPSDSATILYANDEDGEDPATAAGYAHHIGDDFIDIRV
ncbi:MAG: flagellar hook-length control protein FliK [Alphaproteobacteria bacterium]